MSLRCTDEAGWHRPQKKPELASLGNVSDASSKRLVELAERVRQPEVLGVVHGACHDGHGVVGQRSMEYRKELLGRFHAVSRGAEALGICDEIRITERRLLRLAELQLHLPG